MQYVTKRALIFLCAIFVILLAGASKQAAAQSEPVRVLSDRYIVTRKSVVGKSASVVHTYDTKRSTGYFDVVTLKSRSAVSASSAGKTEALDWTKISSDCAEIKKDPSIDICEPDLLVPVAALPNDPLFPKQWSLDDPTNDADIDAPPAWDRGTGSTSIIVGVIDSGITPDHPDLKPNLWSNPGDPVDGIDNDGNGWVDDVFGVNTHKGSIDVKDCSGHGTHVAGIIGAKGNDGQGMTGVSWDVSLVSVNANQDCGIYLSMSAIVQAFNYFYDLKVRGHNIRVINASFGSTAFTAAEYEAIERLNQVGILVVAAAGNENRNLDITPHYPASYDLPNIISVAATGPNLARADYSNYGPHVHIAAPGGSGSNWYDAIVSTYPPSLINGGLYVALRGTSMAAPIVTGALALIASQAPDLSAAELKSIMIESAYKVSSLDGLVEGSRFLNLKGMSELAASITDTCPDDPNKTTPGVCGCGIPDSDSDGDGTFDCQDACASDNSKTSPGVCGCGIADSDTNGNGKIDCLDAGISFVAPRKPRIAIGAKWVVISMEPLAGMNYYLQVTVSPPRGSRRGSASGYYMVQASSVKMRKPLRGSRVKTRYAYVTAGSTSDYSYWSTFASKTVIR